MKLSLPPLHVLIPVLRNGKMKRIVLIFLLYEGTHWCGVFTDVSDFFQSALDSFNVCPFCHGRTGSGRSAEVEMELVGGFSVHNRFVFRIFKMMSRHGHEDGRRLNEDVSNLDHLSWDRSGNLLFFA